MVASTSHASNQGDGWLLNAAWPRGTGGFGNDAKRCDVTHSHDQMETLMVESETKRCDSPISSWSE
jgi:hypothetical protein